MVLTLRKSKRKWIKRWRYNGKVSKDTKQLTYYVYYAAGIKLKDPNNTLATKAWYRWKPKNILNQRRTTCRDKQLVLDDVAGSLGHSATNCFLLLKLDSNQQKDSILLNKIYWFFTTLLQRKPAAKEGKLRKQRKTNEVYKNRRIPIWITKHNS